MLWQWSLNPGVTKSNVLRGIQVLTKVYGEIEKSVCPYLKAFQINYLIIFRIQCGLGKVKYVSDLWNRD